VVVKVLICEELPILRSGLRLLLSAEPDFDVLEATESGLHAMMLVRTHHPDVIVTGLALSSFSGLELIRRLQREPADSMPRVVVFSMSDSDETVTDVLHAGAHGLLIKTATPEELASAVRAAAQGQTMLAPSIAQRLVDWFRHRETKPEELLRPQVAALTSREREVLTLMARGMSTEEVATELCIGVTTVRTHLYRLRQKLDLRDRAQLVSFAFRAGMMRPA
jgi:DNA-binding NarL/FixJ family response regulator